MSTFKQRLLLLLAELEEYNIPNTELSRNMGHSSAYIANILTGNSSRNPGAKFYEYFQARFNCNPDWLRYGTGEMFLPGGKRNDTQSATFMMMLDTLPSEQREAVIHLVEVLYKNRTN